MSSDISNPSLLIVSNQVYVRREDGRHYPALIKSKQGDGYIVQFANEARRQVLEDDLVWLGFWGLPTRCWPRHPTIQTAIASSKTFEGKVRFVGNRTTEERRGPVSFTIRETCGNEKYSTESNYSAKRSSSEGQRCCPERNTQTLARPLAEQGESQPRSSVLRLNKELLHKENSSVTFNASTSSKLTNARDASPCPIQSVPELVEKDPKLNKSSAENGSRTSNETNEQEGARLSLSGESLKYQRRGEQLSLNQDTQWYTRDWTETFPLNQSSLSPPITPSSSSGCLSPEPPMFGAIYQTLANKEFSTENPGLFHDGQVRKKKSRNDAKKCRKVYGVENRHSWCTQCKWKKACTRFKE